MFNKEEMGSIQQYVLERLTNDEIDHVESEYGRSAFLTSKKDTSTKMKQRVNTIIRSVKGVRTNGRRT